MLLFKGKFICWVIAVYIGICFDFPYGIVALGGFDGSDNVCDEDFVMVLILGGGMVNVVEE